MLSVVIFHAFPSTLSGGFIGVDIFFVISGFLITSIIIRKLQTESFSYLEFYMHRAQRIFPALSIMMLSCLAFSWFFLLPDEFSKLGVHTIGGATFTSNLILWSESGYFDLDSMRKPFLHLWSLGVEEQFYLFWPPLLSAIWLKFKELGKALATITILSFASNILLIEYDSTATFYSPFTRVWELSAGGLLAYWLNKHGTPHAETTNDLLQKVIGSFGITILILGIIFIEESAQFPGYIALVPVVGTLLVLAAKGKTLLPHLLSNKVITFFGTISYAFYLWHWPLLSLHEIVKNSSHRDARFAAVVIAIVLATASTYLLERPLRYGKHRTLKASIAVAMLVGSGFFGAAIYFNDGFPKRLDPLMVQLNRDLTGGVTLPPSSTDWCKGVSANFCSHQGPSPTTVLYGDSHGRSLFFGIRELINDDQNSLLVLGNGGCPPFMGFGEVCDSFVRDSLERITSDGNIKTVFITFSEQRYFDPETLASNEKLESLLNGFDQTLRTLKENNKEIIFLFDVPRLKEDVRSCLPRSGKGIDWNPENCGVSHNDHKEAVSKIREILTALLDEYPEVERISLDDSLCNDTWCAGANQDTLFYLDQDHLSIRGAIFVTSEISDHLKKLTNQ